MKIISSHIYPQLLIFSKSFCHFSNTLISSYHKYAHICRNNFLRWFIIRMIHILMIILIALHCISHYHRSPAFSPGSLSPLCPAPRSHWSKPPTLQSHWPRAWASRPSPPQGPSPGFPASDFPARHDTTSRFQISRFPTFRFQITRTLCQIWWVLQPFYILIQSDSPFWMGQASLLTLSDSFLNQLFQIRANWRRNHPPQSLIIACSSNYLPIQKYNE